MQDTPFVLLSSLLLLRSSCFMYGGNPMVESGHASTAASLTLCCDVVQALRPHHFLPLSILTPSPSPFALRLLLLFASLLLLYPFPSLL